jgi:hypothetical protein
VRPRLPLRRERRFMARVRTDWGCDSEFGHVLMCGFIWSGLCGNCNWNPGLGGPGFSKTNKILF